MNQWEIVEKNEGRFLFPSHKTWNDADVDEEIRFLKLIVPRGGVVVDLYSGCGVIPVLTSRITTNLGYVVCVEPNFLYYCALCSNVVLNHACDCMQVLNAVPAKGEHASYYYPNLLPWLMGEKGDIDNLEHAERISVHYDDEDDLGTPYNLRSGVVTVDMMNLSSVDLIYIRHNFDMLRSLLGCMNTIKRNHPYLLLEMRRVDKELVANLCRLSEWGYRFELLRFPDEDVSCLRRIDSGRVVVFGGYAICMDRIHYQPWLLKDHPMLQSFSACYIEQGGN